MSVRLAHYVECLVFALVDILLVEDSPADVRLAQETLNEYKLQNRLRIITDGEDALKFLLGDAPY